MYQKYYTEALILGSREQGEADKVFTLYTKDFGLLRARASAVRQERSRMRYTLQNYSHIRAALVRGKRGWRAVGGIMIRGAGTQRKSVITFARIANLVLRLVVGEGSNAYVFATLSDAHNALMQDRSEAHPTIELVCVARILWGLGYLSTEALDTTLFTHTSYDLEHMREAKALQKKLLSSVNHAISETHL